MDVKSVTRSIRLDEATNARLEELAASARKTVSEYIRWAINDFAQREIRADAHRRAMDIFATLPQLEDPDAVRNEMWGIGTRVPG
jgi:predicted transcriptional regulator